MAIDSKDIPRIKEKIRQFENELMGEFGNAKTKNSVYCTAAQLFQLDSAKGTKS